MSQPHTALRGSLRLARPQYVDNLKTVENLWAGRKNCPLGRFLGPSVSILGRTLLWGQNIRQLRNRLAVTHPCTNLATPWAYSVFSRSYYFVSFTMVGPKCESTIIGHVFATIIFVCRVKLDRKVGRRQCDLARHNQAPKHRYQGEN